jgi:hypothetical protein
MGKVDNIETFLHAGGGGRVDLTGEDDEQQHEDDPPAPADPRTTYLKHCRQVLVDGAAAGAEERRGQDVIPAVKLITQLILGTNSTRQDQQKRAQADEWRDGALTADERNLLGEELLRTSLLYAPGERTKRAAAVSTAISKWGLSDCISAPLYLLRIIVHGEGEKRVHFLRCHLYLKTIILPRQARDKHRERALGVF